MQATALPSPPPPPPLLLMLLLLLLVMVLLSLLLMACAPSRHRVRLAGVTDLPAEQLTVWNRGSASVVVKIASRACRVPGQSSQCSSVCAVWPHLGQLGSTVLSIKYC